MPTVSLTDKGIHFVHNVDRETLGSNRYMQEARELFDDLYNSGDLEVDTVADIPISRDTFMQLLRYRYIRID